MDVCRYNEGMNAKNDRKRKTSNATMTEVTKSFEPRRSVPPTVKPIAAMNSKRRLKKRIGVLEIRRPGLVFGVSFIISFCRSRGHETLIFWSETPYVVSYGFHVVKISIRPSLLGCGRKRFRRLGGLRFVLADQFGQQSFLLPERQNHFRRRRRGFSRHAFRPGRAARN